MGGGSFGALRVLCTLFNRLTNLGIVVSGAAGEPQPGKVLTA
jgi:hypothetical protein